MGLGTMAGKCLTRCKSSTAKQLLLLLLCAKSEQFWLAFWSTETPGLAWICAGFGEQLFLLKLITHYKIRNSSRRNITCSSPKGQTSYPQSVRVPKGNDSGNLPAKTDEPSKPSQLTRAGSWPLTLHWFWCLFLVVVLSRRMNPNIHPSSSLVAEGTGVCQTSEG